MLFDLFSRRERPPIRRAYATEAEFWQGPQFTPAGVYGSAEPTTLPAFYRGLKHRQGILSSLPLQVEMDGMPVTMAFDVIDRPDPAEDRMMTLARLEASCVLRGELVCVLGGFDELGYPHVVKVVDPAKAVLEPDGSWLIANRRFPASEVLHRIVGALPGMSRGLSVVEHFRRTISGEVAAAEFQSNFYRDGGQPTVIITNDDAEATPADMQKIIDRYMAKVAGGRREPIIFPSTTKVEPFTLSNRDSQYLESRQFAVTDLANIVGVPAYFVGAPGASNTYSNVLDQRRDLIDIYLREDLYTIERALSSLLPDGLQVKFNPKSFLRLDPKAEADTLQTQSGWMTIDEIRAVQGLEPLPNGAGAAVGATVLPGSPAPTGGSDAAAV